MLKENKNPWSAAHSYPKLIFWGSVNILLRTCSHVDSFLKLKMFGFYNIYHCLSEKVAFVLVAFVEWRRGRKRETYSITRLHKVFFWRIGLKGG